MSIVGNLIDVDLQILEARDLVAQIILLFVCKKKRSSNDAQSYLPPAGFSVFIRKKNCRALYILFYCILFDCCVEE